MWRSVAIGVVLAAMAAGCINGEGGSSTPAPSRLVVTAHGDNVGTPWHTSWTLRCFPPGGTHPHPQASCAALGWLLRHHAVPPRHCGSEGGGPWTTVRGVYDGDQLALAYAEACGRGRALLEGQALGAYFSHG
jgi:hypothetical protein